MWHEMINIFTDMGAASLLPIVVILLCICLRMKIGVAIRSGFMVGAGFVGIGLVVNMMNSNLCTAAKEMSERFGLNLSVIDLGWQGISPMVWASLISAFAIPIAVIVNIVMLVCKMTKTVNIDIWNIWHIVFTGALTYVVTEKFWIGILGVVVHAVIVYKLGDLWAPFVAGYFELPGITVPHGTSAYVAPVACAVDFMIERIPVINKIDFSISKLQEKIGVFAEPVVIGGIVGSGIGILAGYRVDRAFSLGMEMATVMVLMPQIVKCIMEGLLPLSEWVKEKLSNRFGNGEFYIGLDPAILLGDSQVITAGLLFIPITLLIAMFMPGNKVLPFGDLATISFFIAISVAIHKGNLFRTMISGSVIMYMTIWIANQTIPWITKLGIQTGTIEGERLAAALDQGGSPISYIFVGIFTQQNKSGLLGIGILYFVSIIAAVYYSKKEKSKI